MNHKTRVIVESPYAGHIERNLRYLRACMADSLSRDEAPFASHALYTQPGVLRDDVAGERALGIEAGFAWRSVADLTAVYTDLGITPGMKLGMQHAKQYELRSIRDKLCGHFDGTIEQWLDSWVGLALATGSWGAP